eukprot:TRINITY_DN4912_c0_g1_i1.p1 TRINITY_DN4912_c0_g1~~TRINITY_DN4912_c0_g1_i1.p1  ORF type:complete len:277 (-),score=38.83 TRINITY_DN4912_c0_g1_i1:44-874(-)
MALDESISSYLELAQGLVLTSGLASGYVKSVSRVFYKGDPRTFQTLDFVTLCSACEPTEHRELFCQTTWLSTRGEVVSSVSSTRSAWWRQVRRKLRSDCLEQHLTVYLPCKRAVRFSADVVTILVEKLDFTEIVGEPREPQGGNPSWYHIAQARTRRLSALAGDFECARLESSLARWREMQSAESPNQQHRQQAQLEDLDCVFQLDGCFGGCDWSSDSSDSDCLSDSSDWTSDSSEEEEDWPWHEDNFKVWDAPHSEISKSPMHPVSVSAQHSQSA